MRTVRFLVGLFSLAAVAHAQNNDQSTHRDVGLQPDEHVVFFRSYGHPIGDGKRWDVEITGHIWKGKGIWIGAANASWARAFLGKAGIFFVKNVQGQRLSVQVGGLSGARDNPGVPAAATKQHSVPVTSDEHGEFVGHLTLSDEDVQRLSEQKHKPQWHLTYGLVGSRDEDSRGRAYLCQGSGISVISDIDDTIKDTHVWSSSATVFRSIFPSKAVAGMVNLFSAWSSRSGACFHYISGGPDQMEKRMEHFLDSSGFPEGSLDLRVVAFKDPATTKDWRFGNPCHYKIVKMIPILEAFPERRFCLIGDAGEGDKRALLWLAKRYPDRVKWVFIRHLPPNIKEDFADPKRYEDDCRCLESNPPVPQSVCYREFHSPKELAGLLPLSVTNGRREN